MNEPKEVESGEGLPPLVTTTEEEREGHLILSLHFARWKARERQLKASLLREKGLSDLLKFVEDVIGGWDTLHSFGCSVEDEEIEKLAAVTGDRV